MRGLIRRFPAIKSINKSIEGEYQRRTFPTDKAIPEEIREKLNIDRKTLNSSLIGKVESYLNKTLKGSFFGMGKVKFKESDKTKVKNGIDGIITEFTNEFMTAREALLKEERDTFMDAVKTAINENGNISDAAKKFFQDIPEPNIKRSRGITNLDGIYNSNKRTEKIFFFFEKERLDKKSFAADIKDSLQTIATDMANEYAKDYQNGLETILMAIKSNFEDNLGQYSVHMKNMIDNRDAMKQLGQKIEVAAEDLAECKKDLNSIIWKEV